ncbi:hypothetical protein OSB04_019104 [Centaurea solstitialis]|uniref:Trs120/TRAPPC9 N-terminal domain-containing protein n=1 Tax=Centaurea solstitialis TaxID=347529 RepID=A0AA38WFJ8_9ASTR|nr:hypothetical protein OSB04_019104 [Centaurea solstitialis]
MEPDVSIDTSSIIRIAVLPIGTIHLHLFRKYAGMLSRHHKIELSSITSFYTEHQKSPFSQQPWDSGSLKFKFIVGGSPPSPWEDFQSNRKIHGVIGICHCPSSPDLGSVVQQFATACKGYSSSLVQRCFAFSPGDTQLADGNNKGNKLVLFPPADQRTQEIHLQTMMQDIAASLLMEFEKWVLQAESGGTILKTPLDSQASLSSEEVIKAKKRRLGRAQKTIGDYCLLAGSPVDANAHYSTALELARLTGDYFWYAGALEGGVCALLLKKHMVREFGGLTYCYFGVWNKEKMVCIELEEETVCGNNIDLDMASGMYHCIHTLSSFLPPVPSFYLLLSAMDSKIHPAMTVSNIKNFIPITLEVETAHYTTWSELFQVHCTAYQVADHLLPKATADASSSKSPSKGLFTKSCLSVSRNDLTKIGDKGGDDQCSSPEMSRSPEMSSSALWKRIDAIVLQWIYGTISTDLLDTILKPGNTAHEAWSTLANLFKDNSNTRAVYLQQQFSNIKLENFSNVAAYCQEVKLLADQLASVRAPVDNQRLVLQLLTGLTEHYDALIRSSTLAPLLTASRGRGRIRGRGRGRGNATRGGRGFTSSNQHPYIVFPQSWASNQWASLINNQAQQWPTGNPSPPCPYPSTPRPNTSAGILGAAPSQAYMAGPVPTDINQALYTLSLNHQDQDPVGYMDTGATSHMTNQQGIISPSVFNDCTSKHITVGNGMTIPAIGQGNHTLPPPFPPLKLNNDLKTKAPILRCNSSGDLYPLTTPLHSLSSPTSTFAAITQDRWHQRLGHPGQFIAFSKILFLH